MFVACEKEEREKKGDNERKKGGRTKERGCQ
jgi:hypothetical protein